MRRVQAFRQWVSCRVNPPSLAGLGTRPKRSRDEPRDEGHFEAWTTGFAANGENRACGRLDGCLLPDFAAQGVGSFFAGCGPSGNDLPRMAVPEWMSREANPTIRAEQDSRYPNGEGRGIGQELDSRGKAFKGAQDPVGGWMLG